MSFKFNPLTGKLDLVNDELDLGDKYRWMLATLSAYDKICSITYLDQGLITQRISTVTLSSVLYPDSNVTKTVFYLDVGKKNQRIDKVEYVGIVFSPNSLRKVFSYNLVNTRYIQNGFNYELF
jgi:hypothetical protein